MGEEIETWDGPFHRRHIERGEFGKVSKVREEVEEALDAIEQGQHLMLLIECSDILGALAGVYTQGDKDQEETIYAELVNDDGEEHGPRLAHDIDDLNGLFTRILTLLDGHDSALPLETAREIVSLLSAVVAANRLSYDHLAAFARLRSQVARYAIKKAGK